MKKIVSLCLMLAMSVMMWADQVLYLVPNSNWLQADAKFAVYYFGGDNTPANGWSDIMLAQPDEANVYMTYIPEGYTNVIFVRLNSTATAGSFADGIKWNQTADIALPVDGRNMMTLEDGWDNISGTWSIHGVVPEPQDTTAVEVNYYIKNNWDGAVDWTWQLMEALPGEMWQYVDVYGGTGVNVNTVAEDNGAIWFAESDWDIANNFVPQAGDTLMFWFIPADTLLRVHLIGRPGTIEPVEMVEVRLVPGVWDLDGAKFAAVTWNEGETMEENGVFSAWMLGTDTVVTLIPAEADSIAFGRFDPASGDAPNMTYLWNHTDKLAIDPSFIYTITGWGEAGADCSTGYWGDPVPVDPQGLDVVAMDGNEAVKALQNGVLYIYRNGHKYNVQGQIIR